MLHHIAIRHFQSLHTVELDLAPLTVIVGPSSVGKSAFTRALRLLTSNAKGNSFITHGERIATVTVTTDRGTVSIQRGSATADNSYTVTPAGKPEERKIYSKLGGTTPEEVSAFLGIPAVDPINFAGQFDAPYLLATPGGVAAKTLGDLTNVALLFDGARESNRQKLTASSTLNTRTSDLEHVEAQRAQFSDLPEQSTALDTAEGLIEHARTTQHKAERLRQAVTSLQGSSATIQQLTPLASMVIPSDQAIVDAYARVQRLALIINQLRAASAAYATQTTALADVAEELATLEYSYATTLHDAGQCPTCGQTTERIHA